METNTANSIATRICYEHPKSFSQRIKLLSTLDCDGKLRPVPSVTYKTKNTQDILYVVLGILVFLLVLAVAVFQMLKRGVRYGKCLLFPRRLKPLQRDECALNGKFSGKVCRTFHIQCYRDIIMGYDCMSLCDVRKVDYTFHNIF